MLPNPCLLSAHDDAKETGVRTMCHASMLGDVRAPGSTGYRFNACCVRLKDCSLSLDHGKLPTA